MSVFSVETSFFTHERVMNLNAIIHPATQVLLVSVGMSALLIGSPQPVQAQTADAPNALRELDLSFSQMRQLRSIRQDYQADLEEILTPEQLEEMQDLQAARQEAQDSQAEENAAEDILAELDLSDEQTNQLTEVHESMVQDFQDVLTPEQLEQLEETEFFDNL
ncbi:MAG: hypothetical protein F6K42_06690 [Leptolyngbya sp. SIO1D8]|nr:hypothetical protein [Leptolyngbya sp. SIO1D8]